MEPAIAADNALGLKPIGGSFQASPKKDRRKAKQGTFPRAARVTDELCPANHKSIAPEFHSEHGSFVWQHGSVSKKGYTSGFVSQTPRLGTSFRYTGPGPGIVPPVDCKHTGHGCLNHGRRYARAGAYRAPSWGDKLHSSSKACIISGPPTAQVFIRVTCSSSLLRFSGVHQQLLLMLKMCNHAVCCAGSAACKHQTKQEGIAAP